MLATLKYAYVPEMPETLLRQILSDLPDGVPLEIQDYLYLARVYKMDMDSLRTVASAAKPQRWEGLMDTIADCLDRGR